MVVAPLLEAEWASESCGWWEMVEVVEMRAEVVVVEAVDTLFVTAVVVEVAEVKAVLLPSEFDILVEVAPLPPLSP